jgi:hypothetical protein
MTAMTTHPAISRIALVHTSRLPQQRADAGPVVRRYRLARVGDPAKAPGDRLAHLRVAHD